MLGTLIFLYIGYIVLSSWIFWLMMGLVAAFFGFVYSETFRAILAFIITISVLILLR